MIGMIPLVGKRVYYLGKALAGGEQHPVSERQRKWAFGAEERGELPKGTAMKWSKRKEGEQLPESSENFGGVEKSGHRSNGVEDVSTRGSTGKSEEEAEWDKQNRHPQSHAYNDEQEHNVNAAKKKRDMAAKALPGQPHPHGGRPGQKGGSAPGAGPMYGTPPPSGGPRNLRRGGKRKGNDDYEPAQGMLGSNAFSPSTIGSEEMGDSLTSLKTGEQVGEGMQRYHAPGRGDKRWHAHKGIIFVIQLFKAVKQVPSHVRGGKQVKPYTAGYKHLIDPVHDVGPFPKGERSHAEIEDTIAKRGATMPRKEWEGVRGEMDRKHPGEEPEPERPAPDEPTPDDLDWVKRGDPSQRVKDIMKHHGPPPGEGDEDDEGPVSKPGHMGAKLWRRGGPL